jgi:hypothetical protein
MQIVDTPDFATHAVSQCFEGCPKRIAPVYAIWIDEHALAPVSPCHVPNILIQSLQQLWNTRQLCDLRCVLQTRVQDVWSKVSCNWLRPQNEPGPSLAQFPATTPQTSMGRAHRISTTTQRRACQVFLLQPSSYTLLSPSPNRSAKPHPSLTHVRCQETMS